MSVKLYDFAAEWCGPCNAQDSILDELEDEFPTVSFTKIDVDDNPKEATEYSVRSLPTLVVEVDGEPKERFVGVTDKSTLSEALENYTN
jgi:thioredoxin 1